MIRFSHPMSHLTPCYNPWVTTSEQVSQSLRASVISSPDLPATTSPRRDNWDWILIIGGGAGIIIGFLGALLILVFAFLQDNSVALWVEAASFATLGLLSTPVVYWGAVGPRNRSVERPLPLWRLAILILPLALFLGIAAFEIGTLPRLLGPIAHVLAAGSPVLFVASISLSHGPIFSARRRWSHFLAGLWITPPISLMMELAALVPAGLFMIIGLAFSREGQSIIQELLLTDLSSESEFAQLSVRLVSQPVVILVAIGLLAGAVPLIEELFKTLTIWPLLTRPMSAGQAFLGGALGGAGYALFESLFLPQAGDAWLLTMVARTGTPLIHAFNTGLVCWGLAEAIRRRRWLFFGGTYLLAVGLHGLWNIAAVGVGLSGFGVEAVPELLDPLLMDGVGYLGLLGLLGLTGVSLAGLILLPSKLGDG